MIWLLQTLTFVYGGLGGQWISGGGPLNPNERNPWFVENTKMVHYCIRHDPSAFSATRKQIQNSIRQAFKYWKDEFEFVNSRVPVTFKLATQSFLEIEDCKSADVRFHFGVLSQEQESQSLRHGVDLKKYAAITIRTHYDNDSQKAKGFVFFSPDRRPMLGRTDIWQKRHVLVRVLAHELGHIFGVRTHTGIMSYEYVKKTIENSNQQTAPFAPRAIIPPFFRPEEFVFKTDCFNHSFRQLATDLGFPDTFCARFRWIHSKQKASIEIYKTALPSGSGDFFLKGETEFIQKLPNRFTHPIHLYVRPTNGRPGYVRIGPHFIEEAYLMTIKWNNGVSNRFYLTRKAGVLEISKIPNP